MQVSMLSWKCNEGHRVTHIQIGVDKEGCFWLSWVCEECDIEVMVQVDMEQVKELGLAHLEKNDQKLLPAPIEELSEKDMKFLKTLHILYKEMEADAD